MLLPRYPLVRLCRVLFQYDISSALKMTPHAPCTPQLSHHSMLLRMRSSEALIAYLHNLRLLST